MKIKFRSLCGLVLLLFSTLPSILFGQDCGCDHRITEKRNVNTYTKEDLCLKPGDVVCIEAGTYNQFRFVDFEGSPENPIIIKNCGGQVIIEASTYSGMEFRNSRYVHLTGTGDPSHEFGIVVAKTKGGTSGVAVVNLSSDFEIDHLEIYNTGFAGIIAKTDPDCNRPETWRENFTMKNLLFHHNYIHETEGEGMYIGGTFGLANSTRSCNGVMTFAHLLKNVQVYKNRIENAGWDGIQVSLATQDFNLYDNVIMGYGTERVGNQNFGIALGGIRGRIYNNLVVQEEEDAIKNARGISVIDALTDSYFYNNVIVGSGGSGIWTHIRMPDRFLELDKGYYYINNTIIQPGESGIFFNSCLPGLECREYLTNVYHNNLIIDPGNNYENSNFWKTADEAFLDFNVREQRDKSTRSENLFSRDLSSIRFSDPDIYDFRLVEESPAIDAGRNVSNYGITFDIENQVRPYGLTYDIGAFEFIASEVTFIPEKSPKPYILDRIYPNPAKGNIQISLNLAQKDQIRIEAISIQGKRLAEVQPLAEFEAGEHLLFWDLSQWVGKEKIIILVLTGLEGSINKKIILAEF